MSTLLTPAHKKASAFVSSFQDPFANDAMQKFNLIKQAQDQGTLTYDQAKAALEDFSQNWTAFDTAAQQFKGMGGDYKKVVDQAYDPTGKFMTAVGVMRQSLTAWTDSLRPADTGKVDDGTKNASTPPAGDPKTTQDSARTAAVQQKKRAMSAPGFMSTILGGAGAASQTRKPTLLGY